MKAQTRIDRAWLQRQLAPLQSAWARHAQRIDALSLRERAILFLSIVAVLAAAFDTWVLGPQASRQKQRLDQRRQQDTELAQLRSGFVNASSGAADTTTPWRVQIEGAHAERTRLDTALRDTAAVSSAEGLSAVLQRLLAQQAGLSLERLRLLDDTPVMATAASAPASGATASAPSSAGAPSSSQLLPGMSWQGVELVVRGSYPVAQRYLQQLERELPGLRWGDLQLAAGSGPESSRLQVQLFLLRVQP
jgi:MSHA biogenesis protein MshJ